MSGKVKILYIVTESEWAGASRYVYDLATHLPPAEFDIAVAAAGKGDVLAALGKRGIQTVRLRWLPRTIHPPKDFLAFWEILFLYFRERPDIIHLNSSKAGFLGSIAVPLYKLLLLGRFASSSAPKRFAFRRITPSLLLRVRPTKSDVFVGTTHYSLQTIYTAHGWVFNEPGRANRFFLWLERFASHFRDTIICVSENDRREALHFRIASAGKLVTIHNGIDPTAMKFLGKEEARRKLGNQELAGKSYRFSSPEHCEGRAPASASPERSDGASGDRRCEFNTKLIGTIANLYSNKGLDHLIEALYLLKEKSLIPFTLSLRSGFTRQNVSHVVANSRFLIRALIIGSGPLRPRLEDQIKKHGLEDRVFLAGQIPEARRYLKAFDCFVLPSIKEGLPYAILEALAAGIPVVATNVGGIPEIAKEAFIRLVPPQNPQALAEAIIKTLEEKPSNQSSFPSEFTLQTMAERTRQVYARISSISANKEKH